MQKLEPLGGGFSVYVSKNHTFGTDAVLLANFAAARKAQTACDLGTGCGIVPLLLLRDGTVNTAVGVEISEEAAALATKSAADFAPGRLSVLCTDLKDLKGKLPFGGFDLVTCNPPYKAPGAGILSDGQAAQTARHETACTLEDIIAVSASLLRSSGRFCLCQRPERLAEMIDLMRAYAVEPKRLRIVCKNTSSEPWLVLLEGRRDSKTGMRIEPPLLVYGEDGNLSREMIEIYGDYKEGRI